jgi:hypothetical protein
MVMLALGLAMLALLMLAARAFSLASVTSIKALLAWIAALAGLTIATGLFLTGRGGAAISALVLLGPVVWSWWREGTRRPRSPSPRPPGPMSRAEALEVLGLTDPVTEAEVREAWVRLMRVAHPDGGGSDWLAARVNQARDVLLGRR